MPDSSENDLFTRAALLEITTSTSGVVSAGAVGAAGAALPLWLALWARAAPRDARRRLDLPISVDVAVRESTRLARRRDAQVTSCQVFCEWLCGLQAAVR